MKNPTYSYDTVLVYTSPTHLPTPNANTTSSLNQGPLITSQMIFTVEPLERWNCHHSTPTACEYEPTHACIFRIIFLRKTHACTFRMPAIIVHLLPVSMSQPMYVLSGSFFLGKVTAFGVLRCFALLFDLACFFLPSFSTLLKTCTFRMCS